MHADVLLTVGTEIIERPSLHIKSLRQTTCEAARTATILQYMIVLPATAGSKYGDESLPYMVLSDGIVLIMGQGRSKAANDALLVDISQVQSDSHVLKRLNR